MKGEGYDLGIICSFIAFMFKAIRYLPTQEFSGTVSMTKLDADAKSVNQSLVAMVRDMSALNHSVPCAPSVDIF